MKFSEFLKEREIARSEKFKECMRSRRNKRVLFYKVVSLALKDSNCWKDAIKIRGERFNITGIRLTIDLDMSTTIFEIGYNCSSLSYNIPSIIDPQRIIRVDILLPTIRDPHMTILFVFDPSVISSTLDNINVDDVIASTAKYFDNRIDKLLDDSVESENLDGDEVDRARMFEEIIEDESVVD